MDANDSQDAPSRGTHIGPLRVPRPYLSRLMTAVGDGLQHVRTARDLDLVELAIGFGGSEVAAAFVTASEDGVTGRGGPALDEILSDGTWLPLAEGDDLAITAGIRGASDGQLTPIDLDEDESAQVTRAVAAARTDHCRAVVTDVSDEPGHSGRSSKEWIYNVFSHLPALTGVDHSVALILPDHTYGTRARRQYIVASERLFVRDHEDAPGHLVGLLIPFGDGRGGLIEAAVKLAGGDDPPPYSIFAPTVGENAETQWQLLSFDGHDAEVFPRFTLAADRPREGMLVLVPLALPGTRPGYLALNYRRACAIAPVTAAIYTQLAGLATDALAYSDLFRVPVSRLQVFDGFANVAETGRCRTRTELVERLTPELYATLGAASVAIGLLGEEDGEPIIHFPNPQGWDLDMPRTIRVRTADSLATLAIRMDRPIILAGGRAAVPGTPTLRWNNALYVNESIGQIADARHPQPDGRSLDDTPAWRPLSEYYKPTTPLPVYVGMALPLKIGAEPVGVLGMDFDRSAPWDTYSGFGAEALYAALARLVASHLALLEA